MSFSWSAANQARASATLRRVDMRDVLAGDLHRQRLGLEAGAVADLARARALVARQLLAHPGGLGLEHAAVEVADHALERLLDLVAAAAVDEAQGDGLPPVPWRIDVAALPRAGPSTARRARNRRRGRGWRAPACNKGWAGWTWPRARPRPCAIESAWLGTTRSSSNTSFSPRPSQAGQAPCGALKQNRRGSISAMVKPLTGQANFSEKRIRPGGA